MANEIVIGSAEVIPADQLILVSDAKTMWRTKKVTQLKASRQNWNRKFESKNWKGASKIKKMRPFSYLRPFLNFSTNKKFRFDKRSQHKDRCKQAVVRRSKYKKGRTDANPKLFLQFGKKPRFYKNTCIVACITHKTYKT